MVCVLEGQNMNWASKWFQRLYNVQLFDAIYFLYFCSLETKIYLPILQKFASENIHQNSYLEIYVNNFFFFLLYSHLFSQ